MNWKDDKPTERQIQTVKKYNDLGISVIGELKTKGDYHAIIGKLISKYRDMKVCEDSDFGDASHDMSYEIAQNYGY